MLMIIGAFNWGITGVNVIAKQPFVWIPDLFSLFLDHDADMLYTVQVIIYMLVAVAGAFYVLSYTLPRCFPALA